ncbi:hypothetical protein OIV83_005014 [Microbotryomycetes sp. JL201]|nr:hypothetical protein OIV83_005014 [Microbotryomycetes sp. JL201]
MTSSADPYYEVKSEVEATLQSLETLYSSYTRLQRSSTSQTSQEVQWALDEVKATLSAIEGDLEELDESVAAVEEPGVAHRLGITNQQVKQRRQFVDRVKQQVASVRQALPSQRQNTTGGNRTYSNSVDDVNDLQDPEAAYEMQHQTLLLEQQDRTLTDISGTVEMLREQAKVVGREVYDQNRLLEDIDGHVDSTGNRLEKAQRRMNKFIDDNKSECNARANVHRRRGSC